MFNEELHQLVEFEMNSPFTRLNAYQRACEQMDVHAELKEAFRSPTVLFPYYARYTLLRPVLGVCNLCRLCRGHFAMFAVNNIVDVKNVNGQGVIDLSRAVEYDHFDTLPHCFRRPATPRRWIDDSSMKVTTVVPRLRALDLHLRVLSDILQCACLDQTIVGRATNTLTRFRSGRLFEVPIPEQNADGLSCGYLTLARMRTYGVCFACRCTAFVLHAADIQCASWLFRSLRAIGWFGFDESQRQLGGKVPAHDGEQAAGWYDDCATGVRSLFSCAQPATRTPSAIPRDRCR